ncbi:MAG: thioredoxin family protein [Desulfovibrionaceae bacterium]|nr:thioredoxin family protein [Desulfovibrionaceae bacterium]
MIKNSVKVILPLYVLFQVVFQIFLGPLTCKAAQEALDVDGQTVNEVPAKGMPTLLDLGGDCLPCELQDRIVKRVLPDYKGKVAFIWIEVEKNLENRAHWKVDLVPTLIFFDKNGHEVERTSGYMKESKMRTLLDKLASE